MASTNNHWRYIIRLGLHLNNKLSGVRLARMLTYYDQAWPELLKMNADAFDPFLAQYARSRGAKIIGRRVSSCDGGRPHSEVMSWIREHKQWIDYAENCNEVFHEGDDFNTYCRKCLDWMRECESIGIKACVGNWGTGSPKLRAAGDDVDAWRMPGARDMLDYAGRRGHLIGLHSYYKPRPWYGVQGDKNAWGKVGGFWMLRQKWDVDVWKSMGIVVPKFAITESGRDDIPGTPGTGKGYHDEPRTADGDYADFMAWHCKHLAAIPECAGVVDYGYGTIEDRWKSFDLSVDSVMMTRMTTEMQKIQRGNATHMSPGTDEELRWDKVVWALEQTARILRDEGYKDEHDYLVAHQIKDAIAHRDG